jgi:hypothetical protein
MMSTHESQNQNRNVFPYPSALSSSAITTELEEMMFIASDVRICFQVLDGCGLEGDHEQQFVGDRHLTTARLEPFTALSMAGLYFHSCVGPRQYANQIKP